MLKRENVLKRIRGFYDCSLVKVLYGIKGCGKTTILYQIMDDLRNDKSVDEKHIIFLDLGKEKIGKLLLAFSVPCIISMIINHSLMQAY